MEQPTPPRAICGEDLIGPAAVSPDGLSVIAIHPEDRTTWVCSVRDGKAKAIPGLTSGDVPVQWSADGRALFVRRRGGELPLRLTRFDLQSGHREPLMDLALADPGGVESILSALVTPSAAAYVYAYIRSVSDLYVVGNLR